MTEAYQAAVKALLANLAATCTHQIEMLYELRDAAADGDPDAESMWTGLGVQDLPAFVAAKLQGFAVSVVDPELPLGQLLAAHLNLSAMLMTPPELVASYYDDQHTTYFVPAGAGDDAARAVSAGWEELYDRLVELVEDLEAEPDE